MEHTIRLLEEELNKARRRAASYRRLETIDREGAKRGSTMDKLADMRAKQAAALEEMAADYAKALHLLKQV